MNAAIDALNEKAWSLRITNSSEALKLCEQALAKAKASNYGYGVAESLLTQGFCEYRQSSFDLAIQTLKTAADMFIELEQPEGQLKTLNSLGMIFGDTGRYPEALKAFLQVLTLCKEREDKKAEANALNNLAIIHKLLANYGLALDYHLKSLALYEALALEQAVVRTLQNIGVVYEESGQFEAALSYFEQSLAQQDQQEDPLTFAFTLSNIGRAYTHMGDYAKAVEFQYSSYSIISGLKDKYGEAIILHELGVAYFWREEYDTARAYLQRCLETRQEVGDNKGQTETLLVLGSLLCDLEESDQAIAAFEEASQLASLLASRSDESKAHKGLAKIHHKRKAYQEAFRHLETHAELHTELLERTIDQRFHALRVNHEASQTEKAKDIYRLKAVELSQANFALQQVQKELEKQAKEDPLTGLFNRRAMNETLELAFSNAQLNESVFTLVMCDIDNFKQVNDRFSHQVGDLVLKRVAELLLSSIRAHDAVSRYGGEEFVLMLAGLNANQAFAICERSRQLIEDEDWSLIHPELKLTLSMGLCDSISLESITQILSKADDALYLSKREGKNKVSLWKPSALTYSLMHELG